MKSKTKIEKQLQKKTGNIVDTILAAKKRGAWVSIAGILSGPRRKLINLNLGEINRIAKENETFVVPGKILSQGEINKKIKLVALNFSEKAKVKLLKSGIKSSVIVEEIKNNPEAQGVRILERK